MKGGKARVQFGLLSEGLLFMTRVSDLLGTRVWCVSFNLKMIPEGSVNLGLIEVFILLVSHA